MMDAQERAKALLDELRNIVELHNGDSDEMMACVMAFAAQVEAETWEQAAKMIPTNWCDPLLAGTNGINIPANERGIEELLLGVQDRLRRQTQWAKEGT